MATAFNTTVKLYAGVPLVKGGTEVLYLSAGAAEGVLSAFLSATYTAYYFERENRRYIQIDDVFGSLDSVNYISFANNSHGGKIYFGFVDQVVYVNDHNTQIEFTIDPFPTFLGDTSMADDSYIIRNTLLTDTPRANLQPDYLPESVKQEYNQLSIFEDGYAEAGVLYAGSANFSFTTLTYNSISTGIHVGHLSDNLLKWILDNGGTIIAAFLIPNSFMSNEIIQSLGNILVGNPLAHVSQFSYEKIKSGVYNQVVLQTPNGSKTYALEDFTTPTAVVFRGLLCMIPTPTIYVYPANYRGVTDNIAEGIAIPAPMLPISAYSGYSDRQMSSDIYSGLVSALTGAVAGAMKGGAAGAVLGGLAGLGMGALNMAKNVNMSRFNAPQTFISGPGLIATDNKLKVSLSVASPSLTDFIRIKDYFDYYGYNIETMRDTTTVNLNDGAYLQTGSEFLHGSEADVILNARIMSGIKIRRTL